MKPTGCIQWPRGRCQRRAQAAEYHQRLPHVGDAPAAVDHGDGQDASDRIRAEGLANGAVGPGRGVDGQRVGEMALPRELPQRGRCAPAACSPITTTPWAANCSAARCARQRLRMGRSRCPGSRSAPPLPAKLRPGSRRAEQARRPCNSGARCPLNCAYCFSRVAPSPARSVPVSGQHQDDIVLHQHVFPPTGSPPTRPGPSPARPPCRTASSSVPSSAGPTRGH